MLDNIFYNLPVNLVSQTLVCLQSGVRCTNRQKYTLLLVIDDLLIFYISSYYNWTNPSNVVEASVFYGFSV